MKDYKGMDQGQYNNEKYMKMMKGNKSDMKLMKNHGNTSSIDSDAQKFDMKRMQWLDHEKKGYDNKAFEYKY